MQAQDHIVVGCFANDTKQDLTLYLEMTCEEVILSPGHQIDLLARPHVDLLPLSISAVEGGLQIHPRNVWDPDWMIRFRGQLIKPTLPTILKELP
jgi:hypothetical protein